MRIRRAAASEQFTGSHALRVLIRLWYEEFPFSSLDFDYTNGVEQLAHAFGARECRVRVLGPGVLELNFHYQDALADPVDLPQIVDGTEWTKDAA